MFFKEVISSITVSNLSLFSRVALISTAVSVGGGLTACGGSDSDETSPLNGKIKSPEDYTGAETAIDLADIYNLDQFAKELLSHLMSHHYVSLLNRNDQLWGGLIDAEPKSDSESGSNVTTEKIEKTETFCAAGGVIIRKEASSFTELEYKDCFHGDFRLIEGIDLATKIGENIYEVEKNIFEREAGNNRYTLTRLLVQDNSDEEGGIWSAVLSGDSLIVDPSDVERRFRDFTLVVNWGDGNFEPESVDISGRFFQSTLGYVDVETVERAEDDEDSGNTVVVRTLEIDGADPTLGRIRLEGAESGVVEIEFTGKLRGTLYFDLDGDSLFEDELDFDWSDT